MIDRDPTDLGLPPLQPPGDTAHRCRAGWLGDDDTPRPCPRCKPHLRRSTDPHTGVTAWRPAPKETT